MKSGDSGATKRDVLELVRAHAPEVLESFLSAEDDEAAAVALAQLLGTSDETATELVTHLQFRELIEAPPAPLSILRCMK